MTTINKRPKSKMPLVHDKLIELDKLKKRLNTIKQQEMDLRVEIADILTASLPVGTHKFMDENINVKVKKNITISLDKKLLEVYYDDLNEVEGNCIKFEPKLIESAYKELSPEERETLDMCIITKPAAPTIEIKFIGDDK